MTAPGAQDATGGRPPWLVLLNGPPAVGKTTLARRYADEHPMTLVLELDTLRRLLGAWRANPTQAGLLARAMSLTMAGAHLARGHDVVVPQFLARPQFIADLESLAGLSQARFAEFVLIDDRDELLRRFAERTAAAAEPAHVDAGWLVGLAGGDAALTAMHDRLLQIIATRPRTQVMHCPDGAQDDVYAALLERLDSAA